MSQDARPAPPDLDAAAQALVDEARVFVGAPAGAAKVGRDPVNQPMINHWVQAFGDDDPVYVDAEVAAASRHGQVIAPPAMLQTWTMDALTEDPDGPQTQVLQRLDDAGFSGVVAVDYSHTYARMLHLGDRIRQETSVEDLVGPKITGLGVGFFLTLRNDYRDADGELVGTGRMRLLKFRPPAADATEVQVVPALVRPEGQPAAWATRMVAASNRDTAFWWDAVAAGRLVIQRCTDCSTLRHPPAPMCGACQSTAWDTVAASGRGTVHSRVVHHHPALPGIEAPHTVVLVELDEGVRLVTHGATGVDPETLTIGAIVEVVAERLHDDLVLPLVRPVVEVDT